MTLHRDSHSADYAALLQRCKKVANFHPDSDFGTVGDVWAKLYSFGSDARTPAAELIVGYLSEFIDRHFASVSDRNTLLDDYAAAYPFGNLGERYRALKINAAPQVSPTPDGVGSAVVGHTPPAVAAPTPRTDAFYFPLGVNSTSMLNPAIMDSVGFARQLERELAETKEHLAHAVETCSAEVACRQKAEAALSVSTSGALPEIRWMDPAKAGEMLHAKLDETGAVDGCVVKLDTEHEKHDGGPYLRQAWYDATQDGFVCAATAAALHNVKAWAFDPEDTAPVSASVTQEKP